MKPVQRESTAWTNFLIYGISTAALLYLSYQEFGSAGLRVILIALGVLIIVGIGIGLFLLGGKVTARQMTLGATLVTRHDAVDAAGEALRLRSQGKSIPKIAEPVNPIRILEQIDSGQLPAPPIPEFEVVPFRLPDKLQS